jgi:hypothetical protein
METWDVMAEPAEMGAMFSATGRVTGARSLALQAGIRRIARVGFWDEEEIEGTGTAGVEIETVSESALVPSADIRTSSRLPLKTMITVTSEANWLPGSMNWPLSVRA